MRAFGLAHAAILALVACSVALTACDERATLPAPPATRPTANTPRIISLSPAISRTLVDLDLAKFIVGRSPYCESLDQSIPVVGDLLSVDYEQILQLHPTHVLVQPPAGGVDPTLRKLADKNGWTIGEWRLNGMDDIRELLTELAPLLFSADSTEMSIHRAKAHAVLATLDTTLAKPDAGDAPIWKEGSVLMINAVNPVMAFGTNTYLDDVLLALGGRNSVTDRGWVQLSMEDVVRLAPDAIILIKPDAVVDDLIRELGPVAKMDVPAVTHNRLGLLTHRDALLPSSAVVDVAREVRAIFERFAANAPATDDLP